MRELLYTGKFKKDFKTAKQQPEFDEDELNKVVSDLLQDIPLDEKYHDHPLHGKYEGARECHIKPDWLLIYAKDRAGLKLIMMRTGSHSKLFGE